MNQVNMLIILMLPLISVLLINLLIISDIKEMLLSIRNLIELKTEQNLLECVQQSSQMLN